MEKTTKMQEELKSLQFKYKNDQEKLNQEMMELYKRENMSPFSGCLSSIAQIILILAVFFALFSKSRTEPSYITEVKPASIALLISSKSVAWSK